MKLGVPVCVLPWISVDVAGSAVGTTGVILGVYDVSAGVPFASLACTLTGTTSPEYDLSVGVKVTRPVSLSTVKVPISLPSGDLATTDSAG